MSEDDLLLPTPIDVDFDTPEIDPAQLESESKVPLKLNFDTPALTQEDFSYLNLHTLEETLLKAELVDSGMYLKNIHKGFKFARSTRSLIALVGAGMAVHKRRREVIKEIRTSEKEQFEIDEHGNVKS